MRPKQERAILAVKALDEHRIEDARRNAEAILDAAIEDRAWKSYLLGRVRIETGELSDAETFLQKAAATAMQWGLEAPMAKGDAVRLSAEAMESLGCVYRRREALNDARRSHQAAYQLRVEHGHAEEQSESAASVSLDFVLRGQLEEAQVWAARAIEHAAQAGDEAFARQAKSRGALSTILIAQERFEQGVDQARAACELWRRLGPGEPSRFRAERDLGLALLKQAEALLHSDPPRAGTLLDETVGTLESAERELAAFGAEAEPDARSCRDLLDFTARLRSSLS